MDTINYVELHEFEPSEFLPLLNNKMIREHLVGHDEFNTNSAGAWIKKKLETDSIPGCKVRAIIKSGHLAGGGGRM